MNRIPAGLTGGRRVDLRSGQISLDNDQGRRHLIGHVKFVTIIAAIIRIARQPGQVDAA